MPITAAQYEKLKAKLAENASAEPEDKLSPESWARANDAIREFEQSFLAKGAGADMPRPPEGEMRVIGPPAAPLDEQALVQGLKRKLDPSVPVQPQVLSIQPATGHVKGDEAAKDEWIRGDIDNPNGRVIVYDAPAATVRQKILENPQILKSLGYDMPLTPEAVMAIESGDSIHRAYNDREWRDVADAAVKAGKTPYRYSRAPWLKDGQGGDVLGNLSTKVKAGALPALEQATAFMIGYDDTANFGAASAAGRAGLLDGDAAEARARREEVFPSKKPAVEGATPIGGGNDEVIGGVTASDTSEDIDQLREEHPALHTAGQVVGAVPGAVEFGVKTAARGLAKGVGAIGAGAKAAAEAGEAAIGRGVSALSHWNPANQLWDWVTGQAAVQAEEGALKGLAKGVGGAIAASGVHQTVTEGVQAGANLLGTGDTGTTLRAAAGRIGDAVTEGAIWGVPGTVGQVGAAKHALSVKEGPRYAGLPGRLERHGLEPEFAHGFRPSAPMKAAQEEARKRDIRPIDVYAEELEKPLASAAKANEAEGKMRVSDSQREVFESREGRMLLPAENLATTTVSLLRKRMAPLRSGGKPTAVGTPNADNPVRGIFNANIGGVSTQPLKGAIPIKVEEAEAWLNPVWRRRTLEAAEKRGAVTRPTSDPERIASPVRRLGGSTELARAEPPGGLAAREEGLARVPRYGGARNPELASSDIQKAAPDAPVRGSRRPTEAEATGSTTPRVTARNLGPDAEPSRGARWRRRDKPASKAGKEDVTPGTWGEQLRRRGIRTVYVVPRRYNAQHHESAVQLLRKSRDTNAKDRDLIQIYNAALRDRDARPWRGQPGGWSKLQQQHEQEISRVKDTRRRVAPMKPDGAYKAVVRNSKMRQGQSKDLKATEEMAARAGVADKLGQARSLDPLERLTARISQTPEGRPRAPWSPTGAFDQANMRVAYPITRQIDKRGTLQNAAKLTRVGQGDEQAEERRKERDRPAAKAYAEETKGARRETTSGKKVRKKKANKKRRKKDETP